MLLEQVKNNTKIFSSIDFDELKKIVNKKNYRILTTIEKLGCKENFTNFLEEYIEMCFYDWDTYEWCGDCPTIKWYNDKIRNQWECYKDYMKI